MNLDFLESFRVFASTLNFTHAARIRHLTQPALHKQIRILSEELGVQLYIRTGRSLELTSAGQRLARLAGELEVRIGEFRTAVRTSDERTKVTLAAGRGAYLYLLGIGVRRYIKKGPPLELLTTNCPETLNALKTGRAHLGVTVLPALPEGFSGEIIREVSPHLVVRSDHKFSEARSLTLKQLSGLPLILPPTLSPMRDSLATIFEHEGHSLVVALEATGWELMMHFASLGLGAAIVNGCCRPPRGTVAIPIRSLPSTRYYILHTNDLYFTQDVSTLYQRVRDSAHSATLAGSS